MTSHAQPLATIQAIADQLRNQESALADELRQLKIRRREIARQIRGVRTAAAALGGKGARTAAVNSERRAAVTTHEVSQWVMEELTQRGPMDPTQLHKLIDQRARESGRSLIGLHLRFAKALKNSRLDTTNGMVEFVPESGNSTQQQGKN